jgi:hypothetical protein
VDFILIPCRKPLKAYSPPDEWYCAFSARDESLDFNPGEIQLEETEFGN